jgi:hypothetical protein
MLPLLLSYELFLPTNVCHNTTPAYAILEALRERGEKSFFLAILFFLTKSSVLKMFTKSKIPGCLARQPEYCDLPEFTSDRRRIDLSDLVVFSSRFIDLIINKTLGLVVELECRTMKD